MQINVGDTLRTKLSGERCKVIDKFYDGEWKYLIKYKGNETNPINKKHINTLFVKVRNKHIETIQENYCI